MELRNTTTNEFYGNVGIKADFTDSNGDNLYVGDVVRIEGVEELSVVCGDERNTSFNILGIWSIKFFCSESKWKIYKEKSYRSMNEGDKIRCLKYVERATKEMTLAEIEKELGYSIKIVRENEK